MRHPLQSYLCDTLLSVAEEGAFRPLWSGHILEELRRNLIKAGAKQEAVDHRLTQMTTYFPDAQVSGYESLIESMTNHPKDRHVLAAAVADRADILVTENLKDFPPASTAHPEITVAGQDDFLLWLLDLYPDAVLDALRRQASRYRREPRTADHPGRTRPRVPRVHPPVPHPALEHSAAAPVSRRASGHMV